MCQHSCFWAGLVWYLSLMCIFVCLGQYADPVADLLDQWGVFRARLFRESCVFHRGNYVKDLSRLGRELNNVIIVDNSPASYIFHPENAVSSFHSISIKKGVVLPRWTTRWRHNQSLTTCLLGGQLSFHLHLSCQSHSWKLFRNLVFVVWCSLSSLIWSNLCTFLDPVEVLLDIFGSNIRFIPCDCFCCRK